MGRTGFRCLGAHPQAKRGQGFEEGAEEWSRTLRNACSCEQAVGVHAQQTGCKGGIGEVVFGGGGKSGDCVGTGNPCRQRVDDPEPLQDVPVGNGR